MISCLLTATSNGKSASVELQLGALRAHRGNEAVVEFQKILDHRGVVLNEPIGALAHLETGRAYVMQGAVSAQKHVRY